MHGCYVSLASEKTGGTGDGIDSFYTFIGRMTFADQDRVRPTSASLRPIDGDFENPEIHENFRSL